MPFGPEAYQKDVPEAEAHILDSGHFALYEQAPEVIRLTELFLQKQQSAITKIHISQQLGG